jgi:hypothetical protein
MSSIKNPGRFTGLLYVLASIVGFFAMGYVPDKLIVHGNAAATANNIAASETLFRLGIAGGILGQTAFIFVALALYDLLKEVNRRHASLMVMLIVVSIPIALVNELNSFAALVLVRGAEFLSVGVWLALAGFAWVILSLTSVLLPQYQDKVYAYSQPAIVGEIAFMLWLLIMGAKPRAPDAAASSSAVA